MLHSATLLESIVCILNIIEIVCLQFEEIHKNAPFCFKPRKVNTA